jgi:hypothetical protein
VFGYLPIGSETACREAACWHDRCPLATEPPSRQSVPRASVRGTPGDVWKWLSLGLGCPVRGHPKLLFPKPRPYRTHKITTCNISIAHRLICRRICATAMCLRCVYYYYNIDVAEKIYAPKYIMFCILRVIHPQLIWSVIFGFCLLANPADVRSSEIVRPYSSASTRPRIEVLLLCDLPVRDDGDVIVHRTKLKKPGKIVIS